MINGIHARDQNIFFQLVLISSLLLGGCTPRTNISSHPNPTTATSTPDFLPKYTPRPTWTATIVPPPTFDPNNTSLLYTPTPDPNAFTVSAEFEENFSKEAIARALFSQWLDHFKGENISPTMRLSEYDIDSINIPEDQECASTLGAQFIAEAKVMAKTFLPTRSTKSYNTSQWMISAGGQFFESETLRGIYFESAIFRVENKYTLEVIMQVPMCD